MKSIMISIKPKWVAKILNGEKTIEIRKTMPKCDLPIDVYIYMTKNGGELFNGLYTAPDMNGRVIAKFTMNKCQEWHNYSWQTITKQGCVSDNELRKYSKGHKSLYIWHISNLIIFDKPKRLDNFERYGSWRNYQTTCKKALAGHCNHAHSIRGYIGCEKARLTKAPQNFCYVEEDAE